MKRLHRRHIGLRSTAVLAVLVTASVLNFAYAIDTTASLPGDTAVSAIPTIAPSKDNPADAQQVFDIDAVVATCEGDDYGMCVPGEDQMDMFAPGDGQEVDRQFDAPSKPETTAELRDAWKRAHPRCNLFERFDKMFLEARCKLMGGIWVKHPDMSENCYCPTLDKNLKVVTDGRTFIPRNQYCENMTIKDLTPEVRETIIASRVLEYIELLGRVYESDRQIEINGKLVTTRDYSRYADALYLLGYPCGETEMDDGFEKPKVGFCCRNRAWACWDCMRALGLNIDQDGVRFGCNTETNKVGHVIPALRTLNRDFEPTICLLEPYDRRKIVLCLPAKENETIGDWLKRNREKVLEALRGQYNFFKAEKCPDTEATLYLQAWDLPTAHRVGSCCACRKPFTTNNVIIFPQASAEDYYGVELECPEACKRYGMSIDGSVWSADKNELNNPPDRWICPPDATRVILPKKTD